MLFVDLAGADLLIPTVVVVDDDYPKIVLKAEMLNEPRSLA